MVSENIVLLTEQIEAHPDTKYLFLVPPYSMLWWDCAYVNGELEQRYYILEYTIPALLQYENVEVYFFQDEAEIVCNLDNYMDMIHYSPQTNQYMLDQVTAGEKRVTLASWEESFQSLQELTDYIVKEDIFRYYPSALPVTIVYGEISME